MPKIKLLLAEDDTSMGFLLVDFLENNGIDVKLCRDGESAFRAFNNDTFDFCLLDVMMPKMDGFTLAAKIREINCNVPIIFLTAKSLKNDKQTGFEIGIDDYITKPFDEEELLWRINSVLARVNRTPQECKNQHFEIGKYLFDYTNQLLIFNEDCRRLTVKESEVLKLLCLSKNQITKRETILTQVWGLNDYFTGRSLDVYITKLRKYLKEDPTVQIENIPTVGFLLKIQ